MALKKILMLCLVGFVALGIAACSAPAQEQEPETEPTQETQEQQEQDELAAEEKVSTEMKLKIGEKEVPVTWEENASVDELKELAAGGPLEIAMSRYGGFEQVGAIGQSITSADEQTTTAAGDIVLYSGDQIVVFYGENSWDYTRLGHVELTEAEMAELLSEKDTTLTLYTE